MQPRHEDQAQAVDRLTLKGKLAPMNRRIILAGISRKLIAIAASAASMAAPIAANGNAVVYDFAGTVTTSDFASVTTGMTISGTYTFNLANADLSSDGLSYNGIAHSPGPWIRGAAGGALFNISPAFTGPVFSSAETIGPATFSNSAPSAIGSISQLTGGNFIGGFYTATDIEYTTPSSFIESAFYINDNTTYPFTLSGLPLFGPSSIGTGSLLFVTNGLQSESAHIDYSVTSFTPLSAPEIDPASASSALTLLLGGLAVLRGRRGVVA